VAAIQRHNRRANFADAGKIAANAGQRQNGINAHGMGNPEAVEARFLGKLSGIARFIYGRQRRAASQTPADTKAIIRHDSKPLANSILERVTQLPVPDSSSISLLVLNVPNVPQPGRVLDAVTSSQIHHKPTFVLSGFPLQLNYYDRKRETIHSRVRTADWLSYGGICCWRGMDGLALARY
jgi:hypothetical protein